MLVDFDNEIAETGEVGFVDAVMARKLRIQYPSALYHVINRGNYRRDVFAQGGAAEALERTLFEAAAQYGWRVHAYVVMRNHYHVALETPEPTLVEGMQWFQGTFANRFNRFRNEQGHLFQGRYKAQILEDFAVLGRVVDYIHLNPVRAKIVGPEEVGLYRWSSLFRYLRAETNVCMVAACWLKARGGWDDDAEGRCKYADYLSQIARDEAAWEREGLVGLSAGWALGTDAWRKALARDHARLALDPNMSRQEVAEIRQAAWNASLARALSAAGKSEADLVTRPRWQPWKIAVADRIRRDSGAPISWMAERLKLGKASSVRSYLSRERD